MNAADKSISVIGPVSGAMERTKILLLRPFNMEKWFTTGFCVWLANLFHEGVHGGLSYKLYNKNHFINSQIPAEALDFFKAHMVFIVSAVTATIILLITVALVLLWLSSRGQFMFLDCLAKNKGRIIEPWKTFAKQANSLFRFRLLVILAALVCMTPLGILTVWLFSLCISGPGSTLIAGMIFFVMLLLVFTAVSMFGLVQTLTMDFVVPIMYLQKITVWAGWRIFLPLLWQHFWKIMLYLFLKLLISLCLGAIAIVVVLLGCCFCCIGAVVFIPYVGTVALLPFPSFLRLYTLCFFRQFGSEFDVFAVVM